MSSEQRGGQARRPIYTAPAMEIARGYMLIGVFYVHALFAVLGIVGDPMNAPAAGLQMKLLAPNVAAFFFLNGMTARNLVKKPFRNALRHSLMLVLLAMFSHVVAAVIEHILYQGHGSKRAFLAAVIKPLVYGTGYDNFIGWFLIVLAVARLFVYAFQRSLALFAISGGLAMTVILAGQFFGAPDNIYEWRNWPVAVLFMLIGTRMPLTDRIPDAVGFAAILVALALGWFNSPTLLSEGPCLTCNLSFVAQPMIGQYGCAPIYVVQQISFALFLWWVSGRFATSLPSRTARYFGAAPLQMLMLHGFVLVSIYPAAARGLPQFESGFLFFALMSSVIVAHSLLFETLKIALDRLVMLASKASYLAIKPESAPRRQPASPQVPMKLEGP